MDQAITTGIERACGFDPASGRRLRRRGAMRLAVLGGSALLAVLPEASQAHVRWFTHAADDGTAAMLPTTLLASPLFMLLLVLALAVIGFVRRVDTRLQAGGTPVSGRLALLDQRLTPLAPRVLRIGIALFFASIALYFEGAPITLTPELKSPTWWVVPLQLAIALGLLVPGGVIPACAGMVLLYGYSIHVYGLVHLLDYHLFFGVIVFLTLDRLSPRLAAREGLLVLRLLVATSFIWVGAEKWLYPEWTWDILEHQVPMLAMGMDPAFWALSAGFVEIALAFLMLFGGVSAQVAATVLLVLMSAAIPVVGVVDGIGHLPMLFSLFVLASTRNRLPRWLREHASWAPARFCGVFLLVMAGMTGLYYLAHSPVPVSALQLRTVSLDVLLSFVAGVCLVVWVARTLARNRAALPPHATTAAQR